MSTLEFEDDPLDELFGDSAGTNLPSRVAKAPPASYSPPNYTESCRKCGGTGRYGNWGSCFACHGKGTRSFKTAPQARAANRADAVARKERDADGAWYVFRCGNPEVAAWIESSAPYSTFAASMLEAVRKWGSLTERQLAACESAVAKLAAGKAARAEQAKAAPAIDTSKIEAAFAAARASRDGAGRVMLRTEGAVFSAAKADSANPGAIYVKTGMRGEYLGKIVEGRFIALRSCTPEQAAAVQAASVDPLASAKAYGLKTRSCSCCGRELTDPDSIAAGIGPTCASNYGW